jgi:asparagine synthase (glutamine-hydrolysing)
VIELAARLPENFKRRRNYGKIILREAFSDLIPQPILTRPKRGFKIPLGAWFRKELKEMLHDFLLSPDSCNSNFFERQTLAKIIGEHQSGQADHTSKIWGLLVLELWQRQIQ